MTSMKKILWALALTSVIWSACDDDNDDDDNNVVVISGSDLTFTNQATYANRAEVQLGQLAAEKSTTQGVIDFGNLMATEHQTALDELKAIADDYDTSLPTGLDATSQDLLDTLQTLSGAAFDSIYLANMVQGHATVLAQFQSESTNGKIQRLRDYANKYIPHIQEHHDQADSIYTAIEMPEGNDPND
jgi:putative membrane protein